MEKKHGNNLRVLEGFVTLTMLLNISDIATMYHRHASAGEFYFLLTEFIVGLSIWYYLIKEQNEW
jgi:hypothetical protein